jgi:hypothetical protein
VSTTARFRVVPVVAGEPVERKLQHHFGRARRPAAFAFHVFESLEEAADIEQKTDEFRTGSLEGVAHALARRYHRFREGRHAAAAAIPRHRRAPVRRDVRHKLGG